MQLIGAAAAAPQVDLATNLTGNVNTTVLALSTAYAGTSWAEVFDIPLSTITGSAGQDLIRRLTKNCVTLEGFKTRTKIGLIRPTRQLRGLDLNASPRWAEQIKANLVLLRNFGVPLLVAQESADLIDSPTITSTFVAVVCRAVQDDCGSL